MAKVEIKQPIVDEIKAKIDGAATVVLVDYRGLTVEQDTKLRKGLREAGCEYKVYKNTLMKRAFEGTDFDIVLRDIHIQGARQKCIFEDCERITMDDVIINGEEMKLK